MDVEFQPVGDRALTVKLGDKISLEVNEYVLNLQEALEKDPVAGIVETVPTYASLMIHYLPETIRYEALVEAVRAHLGKEGQRIQCSKRIKYIPICYDEEFGPDLAACAEFEGVQQEQMIEKHLRHVYYCYMLGFAPGHAYMSRFEEPFHFKRRDTPRERISAGSIVAMELLSNLIPFDQPCGWNIFGRTPLRICDYTRKEPFLVHAGDKVRFDRIDRKDFERIRSLDEAGRYQLKFEVEK